MNIAINGYEAVVPRFGYDKKTNLPIKVGSGAYCFELLKSLYEIDKKNNYLIYLPQKPTADMPKETTHWKYKTIQARKLWTVTALSPEFLFKKEKTDVFFTPTHYLPPFAPKNCVITILDVSYIYFPELFNKRDLVQLKKWTKYSAKKAKKILTISKSSKNDIIKEYGVSSEKVAVVYPGTKNESRSMNHELSMDKLGNKFGIKNKYILFVGTLQPRKNVERLIEAFAKLKRDDLDLVIIGKKGWMFEDILNAPKKFNIADRVRFLHEVTDEELPSFYKNAEMFILPSLYEGFGLPILEAMSWGCPVITSNVSSLPEAGGEAVLYVNSESVDDISEKMQKLINDENLRKELIKKGYEQVKKFSWEKTARETLRVLESLA